MTSGVDGTYVKLTYSNPVNVDENVPNVGRFHHINRLSWNESELLNRRGLTRASFIPSRRDIASHGGLHLALLEGGIAAVLEIAERETLDL